MSEAVQLSLKGIFQNQIAERLEAVDQSSAKSVKTPENPGQSSDET